jgi:cytochrome c5
MKGAFCALLLPVAFTAQAALPGDAATGKRLLDANCTGCHDTSFYTRTNRSIRSLEALRQQVDGCAHMAKKAFSAAEKDDIVKYLNDRFYRFE